jgi:transposase
VRGGDGEDEQRRRAGAGAAARGRFLPSVWLAGDETHALRREVARRAHIVRQRTRLKSRVQSILHRSGAQRHREAAGTKRNPHPGEGRLQ